MIETRRMQSEKIKVSFANRRGWQLAGIIDRPPGATSTAAYALFSHCFTCGKDSLAAARVSASLAESGIAVLRFDFTGLGQSQGDFAASNLSTNIDDVVAAADFLRREFQAPSLLIGHSLGGIASIFAAQKIAEAQAVVSINSPSDPTHLLLHFGDRLQEIERLGEAVVPIYPKLRERNFRIQRQFVDDLRRHDLPRALREMQRAYLVLHSANDDLTSLQEAEKLYQMANHPKQLHILQGADHILTQRQDGIAAAEAIHRWWMSQR